MGKWEKEVLVTGFNFAPTRILPASRNRYHPGKNFNRTGYQFMIHCS